MAFGLRDLADLPRVEGELRVPGAAGAEPVGEPLLPSGEGSEAEAGSALGKSGKDSAAAVAAGRDGQREGTAPGADPPQQDPGAGGADVAPRG